MPIEVLSVIPVNSNNHFARDFSRRVQGLGRQIAAVEKKRCIGTGRIMELPKEYPYNPRLGLILLISGVGSLWIGVQRLSWGRMPTGFSLWFGLLPIMLALLVGVRRVALDRRLLLDKDEMILPTGFFQTRAARITYPSIERVWRHYLPFTVVLRVATEKRTFDIVSTLLPDNESYRAIEEFLNLKAQENAANRGISKSQST
jgi:hypothetical protein